MALIWHLALTDDWDVAHGRGIHAISTHGLTLADVGFIHCSYAQQVAGVVRRFYADLDTPLILLGIDTDKLASAGIEVRDEPGDPAHPEGERFPHVYGAIPIAAITQTHDARVIDGLLVAPTWDP